MRYNFVSVDRIRRDSPDCIMMVQSIPSRLRRWFGARSEQCAYYGHDDQWRYSLDGERVDRRLARRLKDLWEEHPTEVAAASARSAAGSARVDRVQEALEESFPASDPPAWNLGTDR